MTIKKRVTKVLVHHLEVLILFSCFGCGVTWISLSEPINWWPTGTTLDLDFINNRYMMSNNSYSGFSNFTSSGAGTFSRGTIATYFDESGTLQTAGINSPRLDYDPTTHIQKGLLIEEPRTNSIRNNTMLGAVVGAPGTMPTNWIVNAVSGMSSAVISTGVESGINYIDVQFSGTATALVNCVIVFEQETVIAASQNQIWSASGYARLISGGWGTYTQPPQWTVQEFNGSGTLVAQGPLNLVPIPTNSPLSSQRFYGAYTVSNASTAYVSQLFEVQYNTGQVVNFTLRIGMPQLELGPIPTSVIPTSGVSGSRSADQVLIPTSTWFKSSQGTLYSQFELSSQSTINAFLADLNDGTANNHIGMYVSSGLALFEQIDGGGILQYGSNTSLNSVSIGAVNRAAISYQNNNFSGGFNGSAMTLQTSGTAPIVTQLELGAYNGGSFYLNGWLQNIQYYNSQLSPAQVQQLSGNGQP